MIAVVADDLTGAAELGGIGLRYNLSVEICTQVNAHSVADLLIISTDSRSKSKEEAERETEAVLQELVRLKPKLIYKKIDSVLRGHILPELNAQLRALKLSRALVVPANPLLGRTITNGTYYFQGIPIHQSSFSQDPEFPLTSSRILDILQHREKAVFVQKYTQPLPATGIIIGEVSNTNDLKAWAKGLENDTALAGASVFFSALLEENGLVVKENTENIPLNLGQPGLLVCGSTFAKSRTLVKTLQESGGPVNYMPQSLLLTPDNLDNQIFNWAQEIIALIKKNNRAVLAIDPTTGGIPAPAATLREIMARTVQLVFEQTNLEELYLEGGSTASAILKRIGLNHFYPQQELAPGVIRMKVAGIPKLNLTLKPGSYDWPDSIWNFN